MLITTYAKLFKEKFDFSAEKSGLAYARDLVKYDLDEKLYDPEYIQMVIKDGMTSIFHKKRVHSKENEYRFSVLCPNKPKHYELFLEDTKGLYYSRIILKENCSDQLVFHGFTFDENKKLLRYSSQIGVRFIKS